MADEDTSPEDRSGRLEGAGEHPGWIDIDQPPVETEDFKLFVEIITAIARELEEQDLLDDEVVRREDR